MSGNAKFLLYFALGFDLFSISYNCYIKRYCALSGRRYFKLVGDKVTSWIKESLGLKASSGSEDPIAMLNKDIDWEMITENTITKAVAVKIQQSLK